MSLSLYDDVELVVMSDDVVKKRRIQFLMSTLTTKRECVCVSFLYLFIQCFKIVFSLQEMKRIWDVVSDVHD